MGLFRCQSRRGKVVKMVNYRSEDVDKQTTESGTSVDMVERLENMKNRLEHVRKEKEVLRNLDLFVLDNSLRETTVGMLRGHTLKNKRTIYEQVKKVGFNEVIVESFNHQNRLGEPFIRELVKIGEDMSNKWAFTELFDKTDADKVPINEIPIGLKKCKEFGLKNVIIEMDLMYFAVDYSKFPVEAQLAMLSSRLKWIKENLSQDARVFVNLRDFSPAMKNCPEKQFKVISYIANLPTSERPFGLAYEEGGRNLPEELAVWTSTTRQLMDDGGWTDGHLIVHVHEHFGMADIVQLECLANGATGIWAGLCEEGAAMGHASSCLTIINLIKLGNTKVLKKFNCSLLREASREVTLAATGAYPHPKEPITGDRAMDVVFSFDFAVRDKSTDFNLPEFLGRKPTIRISNMSSYEMIKQKLVQVFGEDERFTLDIATQMKNKMLDDLRDGVKEEYNSTAGLAALYDRSGGCLTEEMQEVILTQTKLSAQQQALIAEVRRIWDFYDMSDGKKDDKLNFDGFYDGFMAPHFGCYRCEESQTALACIDMDADGFVEWKEFAVFLNWAAKEYPKITTAEELITVAFNKGIKPAMQDEILQSLTQEA